MDAQLTLLRQWKSEYDQQSCEDAAAWDLGRGLLAVADGAGSASFSDLWAKILTSQFISTPLLSADPFELEWWLSLAQRQFASEAPDPEGLDPAYARKAREGSYAALATLRVIRADRASADAHLLAVGDACTFHLPAGSDRLLAFPKDAGGSANEHPVLLPTRRFDRDFHRPAEGRIGLRAGDVVALSTDAVARWILTAGQGRLPGDTAAFRAVIACPPDAGARFVADARAEAELEDDDSTILVVRLF